MTILGESPPVVEWKIDYGAGGKRGRRFMRLWQLRWKTVIAWSGWKQKRHQVVSLGIYLGSWSS